MGIDLKGVMPPHITPLTASGTLDEEGLREDVAFWVESGVSGLVPCGSNGESVNLSFDEKKQVIDIVVDEVNGRTPVIAGTGSSSTPETILLSKCAIDLGVDALLVVTPYYFPVSQEDLYHHYHSLIEKIDHPIILYDVPKFTGVTLNPETVQRLTKFDQIIGIKESSTNLRQIAELVRSVGEKITVLSGSGSTMFSTLTLGGKGAIAAIVNVAPALCARLYNAVVSGNTEEARLLQLSLLRLDRLLTVEYPVSGVKAALEILGKKAGPPRMPFQPVPTKGMDEIKSELSKLSLIHG